MVYNINTNVAISTQYGKYAPKEPLLSLTIRDLLMFEDIYDHVSKVIEDRIISKMQGAVSVSIKTNGIIASVEFDVPNVSYLVDELLWAFRCNATDKHYASLCVEAFGSKSNVDILPKSYSDFTQWIRVSVNTYLEEKKFKFEYENMYENGVICDTCIADSEDIYSSLQLPKTDIVKELSADCHVDKYKLSNLTIRMIQEEEMI